MLNLTLVGLPTLSPIMSSSTNSWNYNLGNQAVEHLTEREAEKIGIGYLGEEKAQGGLYQCLHLVEGCK